MQKKSVDPPRKIVSVDELEKAGVLSKKRGSGCFVSAGPSKLADREKRRILEQRIDGLLTEARQLNYRPEELFKLIHKRLSLFNSRNEADVANGDK
jgi:DNA-binding transcriptional regulator YhcF (GntR family)